jgi:2-polyprenyl-3-methyl-5-hydroxy-6-metoxy-1,4-benzoquinol methylase
VGSGVGNQTQFFVAERERVIASDIEPHYLRELTSRFSGKAQVRIASFSFPLSETDRVDLHQERIDTIVCLNVLEHIDDHVSTLKDFNRVLQPGGHLVLIVPALKALYGTLDKHLHHFRRYSTEELRAAVTEAGFVIDTMRFLNRPAVPGWWLSSRVLKRKVVPKSQLKAFKWIMPLLKLEEQSEPSFGLSLLVLARRP